MLRRQHALVAPLTVWPDPHLRTRQVSVDHNAALHGVELQDIQLHRISLMERSRVVRGMMTCVLWLAACGCVHVMLCERIIPLAAMASTQMQVACLLD